MKKQTQPAHLLIVCADNQQEAAVRIYENYEVVYYSSTRIAGVVRVKDGYLVKDVDAFVGKKYELKLLESKKILTGTVDNENSNSKSD